MTLVEVYKGVAPSVVAFVSKWAATGPGHEPFAPPIFGTGFLVHEDGVVVTNRHVAELFQKFPKNPATGAPGYGAMLGDYGSTPAENAPGESSFRLMVVDVVWHSSLPESAPQDGWFGEPSPDIAFVQLEMRQTPFLKLADRSRDFYVEPGLSIATAGFPMGTVPLTIMGKWNQFIPFVRRGVVSSVFPCGIAYPHGFTIDIMQQGGASGSPIFYADDPTVVGMMAASVLDSVGVASEQLSFQIGLNTNMSVAVPAHIIEQTLRSFFATYPYDRTQLPTMAEWRQRHGPPADGVGWIVPGLPAQE